ncbi:MAG TPA: hypothetical protein VMZ30_04230 [Pyrinomonadaceae bacterium]|nr:hypothetical protein [Pyrinomonadaceae bacterium]
MRSAHQAVARWVLERELEVLDPGEMLVTCGSPEWCPTHPLPGGGIDVIWMRFDRAGASLSM